MNQEEFDRIERFVQSHPKGHFMQSPRWGVFKSAWKSEFVTAEDEKGNLKGSMHLLIRKTPVFGYALMYSPRGPVCDVHDKETIRELVGKAEAVAKENRCYALKLDPDVSIEDKEFSDAFRELGFQINSDIKGFDGIQPHFVFRLNIQDKTEEEIMAGFSKKHRKNVRRAIKYGITVRDGKKEELPLFYNIMKQTGDRQQFGIRPLSYFERMYDLFAPDNLRYLILEYEGEVVCACISILYGDKVWCLYSATADCHRDKKATYLMRWELIKWGMSRNCRIFDLMGVPGVVPETDHLYGLYSVKKGFGGDLIEFAGEMDDLFHPKIALLVDTAANARKNLMGLKRKLSSSGRGEKDASPKEAGEGQAEE